MATAMIKPIMQDAILMGVTVVGPVPIWSNALNVGVWLDPLQIIYVRKRITRAYAFLTKSFSKSAYLYENLHKNLILELRAKNFYSYVYSINYGWKILERNYIQKPNVNICLILP